jgi:hypothetical protein
MTKRLPVVVIVIGFIILISTMYFESEPTLVPLLVILSGLAWHLVARRRTRRQPVA